MRGDTVPERKAPIPRQFPGWDSAVRGWLRTDKFEGERVRLKFVAAGLLAMLAGVAGAQNINAAGATFPYPIYNRWFSEYAALHPSVHINYQSIGSGGGIKQVSEGTVDFGASDEMCIRDSIDPAVQLDRAGVFADDSLRDPQSEAGAAFALGGKEGLEEVLANLWGDAWAIVRDLSLIHISRPAA